MDTIRVEINIGGRVERYVAKQAREDSAPPSSRADAVLREMNLERVPVDELTGECERVKKGSRFFEGTCSICLCEYKPKQLVRTLRCSENHAFHKGCVDKWLTKNISCPICRIELGTK